MRWIGQITYDEVAYFREDVIIEAGNKLGIGTTSPDSLLEISSSTANDFIKLTSAGGDANPIKLIFEKSSAEQGIIEYNRNGDLEIYNTDSDGGVMIDGSSSAGADFYVANSGNVLIGTTTDSGDKLTVAGNLVSYHSGYTTDAFRVTHNSNDVLLSLYKRSNQSTPDVLLRTNGDSYLNGGNVGIGTDSPSELLNISSGAATHAKILIDAGADADLILDKGAGSRRSHIDYKVAGTTKWYAGTADSDVVGDGDDYFIGTTVGGSNAEFFLKRSNGNVGIGTTAPEEKLSVSGNIQLTNQKQITWSDIGDGNTGRVAIKGDEDNDFISFKTDNSERMRLTNTGLGIGTTSPGVPLEVQGSVKFGTAATGISHHIEGTDEYRVQGIDVDGNGWNSLHFKADGNDGLFLQKDTNNVGIGTTSPGEKLEVISADNVGTTKIISAYSLSQSQSTSLGYNSVIGSYALALQTLTTQAITFRPNSVEKMRITDTGYLGIGTTAPTHELMVQGNMRLTGAFRDRVNSQGAAGYILQSTGSNGTEWIDPSTLPGNADTLQEVTDNGNITTNDIILSSTNFLRASHSDRYVQIQNGNAEMTFSSYGNQIHKTYDNVSYSERMRLTRFGNLGIGTTAPLAPLDVNGNIYSSGNVLVDNIYSRSGSSDLSLEARSGYGVNIKQLSGNSVAYFDYDTTNVGIGTTTPSVNLQVYDALSSQIKITNGLSTPVDLQLFASSSSYAGIGTSTNHRLALRTNNSEKLTILGDGNVGIGTTSPSSPLTVAGRVDFQGDLRLRGTDSALNQGVARFYVDSSNKLFIDTSNNGSNLFTIDSAGNVGIGTTAPADLLHIADTSSSNALVTMRAQNNLGYAEFGTQSGYSRILSGGYLLYAGSYGATYFYVNASTAMTLNSTGLGIGTTSPTAKLESISPNGSQSSLRLGRGDASNYWDFNHAGNDLRILNSAASGSNILFGVDAGGGIKNNNVGIGTAQPTEKLHVVGKGIFTDQVTIPATPIATTDAASKGYVDGKAGLNETLQDVTDNGNTTTNDIIGASLTLGDGTTSEYAKVFYSDGSYTKILGYGIEMSRVSSYIRPTSTNTTDLYIGNQTLSFSQLEMNATIHKFANGTAEKMRITSAGNVLIGTTTDSGDKLTIAGNFVSYHIGYTTDAFRVTHNSNDVFLSLYKRSNQSTPDVLLRTNGNSYINGGNVGIGTITPSEKLHIKGAGGTGIKTMLLIQQDDDGAGHPGGDISLESSGWGQAFLKIGGSYSIGATGGNLVTNSTSSSASLVFKKL